MKGKNKKKRKPKQETWEQHYNNVIKYIEKKYPDFFHKLEARYVLEKRGEFSEDEE